MWLPVLGLMWSRVGLCDTEWTQEAIIKGQPECLVYMRRLFDFFETTILADGRNWVLNTDKLSLADIEGQSSIFFQFACSAAFFFFSSRLRGRMGAVACMDRRSSSGCPGPPRFKHARPAVPFSGRPKVPIAHSPYPPSLSPSPSLLGFRHL